MARRLLDGDFHISGSTCIDKPTHQRLMSSLAEKTDVLPRIPRGSGLLCKPPKQDSMSGIRNITARN